MKRSSSNLLAIKTFGNSMYPFFYDGDVVYVEKVSFARLKINDFITFKKKDICITHRIIYTPPTPTHPYVLTKGDANLTPDEKVYPKDLIGKVVKIKRNKLFLEPQQLYLFQSTFYFDQIRLVNTAFAKANIDMVFLKGLPIHLYVEKKHPGRMYADCDMLVGKTQLQKTKDVLKQLGFREDNTAFSPMHKRLKDKPTEMTFSKSVHGFEILLDIHAEVVFGMNQLGKLDLLYPQSRLDAFSDTMLSKKRYVHIQHEVFPILRTEYLIMYLALHLFHHNFKGYYRYHLLDVILRKENIEEKHLIDIIERYTLRNFVYPVFMLLHMHYKTPLSKQFLRNITPEKHTHEYIKKTILPTPIFNEEYRIQSGVDRFTFFYRLSPTPTYKKIFIFLKPAVLYSIVWVGKKWLTKQLFLQGFSFSKVHG